MVNHINRSKSGNATDGCDLFLFISVCACSYTPEFIPPASNQLLVQPVDTGAFTFDLLKMFLHFLSPF